jgi:carbon-monoxide dehydrogenase medium subunit
VDGVVADARIALGGVGGTAVLATRAAAVVRAGGLTEDAARSAAAVAAEEVRPLSDHRGSADYKRAMVRVWVRRALRSL